MLICLPALILMKGTDFMVFCVGLSGNIASGKTSAARLFSALGVDVFSADEISRDLTKKNTVAYQEIVHHFGLNITDNEGNLNRPRLRGLIFSNPDERAWLEQLLHPLIRLELANKVSKSTAPYCMAEIPLSIDKQNYPYLNKILIITSPLVLQIERIKARDNCSEEQALAIISVQPSIKERLKESDDRLINEGSLDELEDKVLQLHQRYMHEALSN